VDLGVCVVHALLATVLGTGESVSFNGVPFQRNIADVFHFFFITFVAFVMFAFRTGFSDVLRAIASFEWILGHSELSAIFASEDVLDFHLFILLHL